jgi:hypothetical protein
MCRITDSVVAVTVYNQSDSGQKAHASVWFGYATTVSEHKLHSKLHSIQQCSVADVSAIYARALDLVDTV